MDLSSSSLSLRPHSNRPPSHAPPPSLPASRPPSPPLPVTWSAWQCVFTPMRHVKPSSSIRDTSLSTVRSTGSIKRASLAEGGREGGM
jgi:hypothetical protein